jgi:S-formylglutathione hydrolase FrmB
MIAWVLLASLAASPANAPTNVDPVQRAFTPPRPGARDWIASFDSPELVGASGNGRTDPARVGVHLPPDPSACPKQCWLVVLLPGFDATPEVFALAIEGLDRAEKAHTLPPLLVLTPDGRTRLGGGWYTDSISSGQWASWLWDRVLPAARATVAREIPAERTVVLGHSMGGFGAISFALTHPEAFAGAAGLSPILNPKSLFDIASEHASRSSEQSNMPNEIANPKAEHFFERIHASLSQAFLLRNMLIDSSRSWTVVDLTHGFGNRLRLIKRIYVASGNRDVLVPAESLEDFERELREAHIDAAQAEVVLHDGDHLDHRDSDIEAALRFLTASESESPSKTDSKTNSHPDSMSTPKPSSASSNSH